MGPTCPWRLQCRSGPWTLPMILGHRCEDEIHHHYWHRVISSFLHHAAHPHTWKQDNPCNQYYHLRHQGRPCHHKPSPTRSHWWGPKNIWVLDIPLTGPASTQGCAQTWSYWGPISKGGPGIQEAFTTCENVSNCKDNVICPTMGATSKGGHPNF